MTHTLRLRPGLSAVDAVNIETGSPSGEMATGAVLVWTYDATNDLADAQAIADPAVSLFDKATDALVEGGATLLDPAVIGSAIYLALANCERGHEYRLVIEFGTDPEAVTGEHIVRYHTIVGR